jgi:hypothetical protein
MVARSSCFFEMKLPSIITILLVASQLTQAAPISFNDDVRPILNKHCISCHGGVKKAGDVSWLFREDALVKGESGLFALVPGKPEESNMLKRIVDQEDPMPPPEHGPMLSKKEVEIFRRWIEEGAQWQGHWAFDKPVRPATPVVKDTAWPRSPMDSILLAKMEAENLKPEGPQDPARLLRRVSFDLTGMPPSPEEVEAFIKDPSQAALEKNVDRLLASPRFGEHWATMWLDAVRYADSKGLGQDAYRDMWQYRDWVVNAMNADMPFDQFTIKQLAGDLLPNATMDDRIATACHRNTATNDEGGTDDEEFRIEALIDRVSTTWQTWQGVTFGCVQCHTHPYDPFHHEEFYKFAAFFNQTRDVDTEADYPQIAVPNNRQDFPAAEALDKKIKELSMGVYQAGVSLNARPNMWKPIQGMTAQAKGCGAEVENKNGRDEYVLTGTVPVGTAVTLEAPVPAGLTQLTALRFDALPIDAEKARTLSEWGFVLSNLTVTLTPADGRPPIPVKFARVFSDEPNPFLDPEGTLRGNDRQGYAAFTRMYGPRHGVFVTENPVAVTAGMKVKAVLEFKVSVQASAVLVARRGAISLTGDSAWTDQIRSQEDTSARAQIADLKKKRDAIKSTKLTVMEELEPSQQRSLQLFIRGNYLTRGEETPAAVPHGFPALPAGAKADRLAMAQWLFLPDHPLTSRVMVNRLWERLFGTGIVESMEDFGSAGEKPFNPKLLDWLAVHFREDLKWSMKAMLREMVLSAAYGQDNRISPEKLSKDPANRFVSRGPRLRLTAEMIRDQALQVSGLLSNKMHGPPVYPPIPQGVWAPFLGEKWAVPAPGNPERYRRALYTLAKRSIPYPGAAVFDSPTREVCSQRRISSNTPVQALTLMNDEVFDEAAANLAKLMIAASPEAAGRIGYGYREITGRVPEASVTSRIEKLVSQSTTAGATEVEAWKNAAIVLLNMDEAINR